VVLTIGAAGLGIFAKRVFQQQARLVKPARGGGHHQEMADPAKYGTFRIPHVSDTHKRLAHVRNLLFLHQHNERTYTTHKLKRNNIDNAH